jgi:hypothetical protein
MTVGAIGEPSALAGVVNGTHRPGRSSGSISAALAGVRIADGAAIDG